MGRKKREHVVELYSMPNVFLSPDRIKGNWHERYFKNNNPIIVEVGCGRGEYTVALGRKYPDQNFIGMDAKGPRLWRGAKTYMDEAMSNGAFICGLVELITDYFAPGEVAEIWVTFPDPQPKPSREQQRLVSSRFLNLYRQVLKPGGMIHFKTDNDELYAWAIKSFKQNPGVELLLNCEDVDKAPELTEIMSIQTKYEKLFRDKGQKIKYAKIVLV